jgi:hypothetical protein
MTKLLTIPEIIKEHGDQIRWSKPFWYSLARKGEIPTIRYGRKVCIPSWFVDKLLAGPESK